MEWLSGFITAIVIGWLFYWLGGRDLKNETKELRRLNRIILLSLKNAGLADVTFDKDGNIVGLTLEIKSVGGGSTAAGTRCTVTMQQPEP